MNNSLVIILFDHAYEHTADYSSQTGALISINNLVIGLLLKDAKSVKEIVLDNHKFWLYKKINKNYFVIKPLFIIPFRRFRFVEYCNYFLTIIFVQIFAYSLQNKRKVKKKYLWIFNPEHYPLVKLFSASIYKIYDCVDFHGDEVNHSYEALLIKTCNLVTVNSHVLYKINRMIRQDIHMVPFGFDLKTFSKRKHKPAIILPHNQPIVGYVGGLNSRINYSLLMPLIHNNRHINFVFVGPIQTHESPEIFQEHVKPKIDKLLSVKNVFYYPYVQKNDIPTVIRQFDIGLIPYDTSLRFNRLCFPMKVFEYFYFGKPVISTPIEELKRFPRFVKMGSSSEELGSQINLILSKPWPKIISHYQKQLSIDNSWEKKFDAICESLN